MCFFPLYTSHSYTSSLMHRVSCLIQRSAITWSSSRVKTWDIEKVKENALITVFKAFFEIKVVLKQDSYLSYWVVWGIQNNCLCFGIKFICKFSRIQDPISTRCRVSILFLKKTPKHKNQNHNKFIHDFNTCCSLKRAAQLITLKHFHYHI